MTGSADENILDSFLPFHLRLDVSGQVQSAGRSLQKIFLTPLLELNLFQFLSIYRPARFDFELLPIGASKAIKLRAVVDGELCFDGLIMRLSDGFILNLSMGLSLYRVRERYQLSAQDFAPTDASFDLLYMVELQQAQLTESKRLSKRLFTARNAAQREATRDALTGLVNRRSLDEYLASTHKRPALLPFAFLLIDLDYFKQVNDRLGHLAGDEVLRVVSKRLQSNTRSNDVVARVGGDEFAIVLSGLKREADVTERAERIIEHICQPIKFGEMQTGVGASIGARIVSEPMDQTTLIKDVDAMLYTAKKKGRGQVCFWEGALKEA